MSPAHRTARQRQACLRAIAPPHLASRKLSRLECKCYFAERMDYRSIITLEPGKRGGKPCVRGLRIAVEDVLGWLASGMSTEEILTGHPELTHQDVLAYAAGREKHVAWVRGAE